MSSDLVQPHTVAIPDSVLLDLKQRLASTRWPERETVSDWSQGVPLAIIQDLCEYWLNEYDWRRCENWINHAGSSIADIDGYKIHFLHIQSRHKNALPLLLVHGWPGSTLEFRKAIGPLTDPSAYGGEVEDAFHLVIPAMPGYGFSSKPKETGLTTARIAQLYTRLMENLGYTSWTAQGGDWGADVCAALAAVENNPSKSLLAVHLNSVYFNVSKEILDPLDPTDEEKKTLEKYEAFSSDDSGYKNIQSTRPQTIGYSLADSPVGQAAWIYEKLHNWSQNDGDLQKLLTKDEILDNIMLYWLSNAGASSARLYWEEKKLDTTALKIDIPISVTQFPGEHGYIPRQWGERYYSNITYWHESEAGGHFAAWEVPEIFVREVREAFRKARA